MSKVEKLTPHSDGKRRVMIMKTLSAVALTAHGANPEANVTFYKSTDKPATQIIKDELLEKRLILSDATEGHTHLIRISDFSKMEMGGDTGWTMGHDHPFVIDDFGNVTIGESHGHTHLYSQNIIELLKIEKTADNGKLTKGEDIMGNEDKNAVEHAEELAALKALLATAVKMGLLSDAQKTHYSALKADAKETFLGKSVEEREAVMVAIKAENPEVYKSTDGTVFHKSDDPRFVEMAKQNDANKAALIKAQKETADIGFAKRASEEFGNLPGKPEAHIALIKAVATISDEAIRKEVEATLKAHNTSMSSAFNDVGTTEVSKQEDTADKEMDRLAKAHVTANPAVNYYDAYDIIAKANPKLHAEAVKG